MYSIPIKSDYLIDFLFLDILLQQDPLATGPICRGSEEDTFWGEDPFGIFGIEKEFMYQPCRVEAG